jgi:hypothetical protein
MMAVSINDAINQLLAVLDECFIPVDRTWTYFTDNKPDAGFIGLLSKLSAADASRKIAGNSIASHAHHVRFSLIEAASWIRGDHSQRDWAESWNVNEVDNEVWSRIRQEIFEAYKDLREAIGSHAFSDVEAFGGAAGVVAHMSFHLGAIRQKAALLSD